MRPYKKAREEARSGGGSLFKLITLPGYTGSVWTPKWSNESRLETHFRPTGPLTADGTAMMPWRASGEPGNYGEWITGMPILTMGTANKETFIAAFEDPDSPGDILDPDIHTTPAYEFITNIKRLCRDNTRLENLLMKGGKGRAAAVPGYIATRGLVQGILLRHGTTDYYSKPVSAMLMLTPSACAAMEEALDAEVEGYNGDPDNYAARFKCGDVLDADGGRILSFYNANTAAVTSDVTNVNWNSMKAQNKMGAKKDKSDFSRYACDVVAGPSGAPMTLPLPRDAQGRISLPGMQMFTPWSEVLRFLSEDEMIDVIVKAFADMPEIVLSCLKSYHDKLPAYVKNSATSIAMGNLTGNTDQLPGLGQPYAAPSGSPQVMYPQGYGQPQVAPQAQPQGFGPGQMAPQAAPQPGQMAPQPAQQTPQTAPAAPETAAVSWNATPSEEEKAPEFIPQGAITPEDMANLAAGSAPEQAPAMAPAQNGGSNADAVAAALERINNLKAQA